MLGNDDEAVMVPGAETDDDEVDVESASHRSDIGTGSDCADAAE